MSVTGILISTNAKIGREELAQLPTLAATPRRALRKYPADVSPRPTAVQIAELAIDKQVQTLLMPIAARRQLNELPDELWTRISIEFTKTPPIRFSKHGRTVRSQILHHQVDGVGRRIMGSNLQQVISKLGRRAVRCDPGKVPPCFGRHATEAVGGTAAPMPFGWID